MIIKTAQPSDIRPSEITHKDHYLNRRRFIQDGMLAGGALLAAPAFGASIPHSRGAKLENVAASPFSTTEAPNSYEDITSYNNYYEFGTGKSDPARRAQDFEPRPWSIEISGHAEKTGTFDLDDIVKPHVLQERIYRLRCVEAWSMVIPWP